MLFAGVAFSLFMLFFGHAKCNFHCDSFLALKLAIFYTLLFFIVFCFFARALRYSCYCLQNHEPVERVLSIFVVVAVFRLQF